MRNQSISCVVFFVTWKVVGTLYSWGPGAKRRLTSSPIVSRTVLDSNADVCRVYKRGEWAGKG